MWGCGGLGAFQSCEDREGKEAVAAGSFDYEGGGGEHAEQWRRKGHWAGGSVKDWTRLAVLHTCLTFFFTSRLWIKSV